MLCMYDDAKFWLNNFAVPFALPESMGVHSWALEIFVKAVISMKTAKVKSHEILVLYGIYVLPVSDDDDMDKVTLVLTQKRSLN